LVGNLLITFSSFLKFYVKKIVKLPSFENEETGKKFPYRIFLGYNNFNQPFLVYIFNVTLFG
jgi:hypothetical protein